MGQHFPSAAQVFLQENSRNTQAVGSLPELVFQRVVLKVPQRQARKLFLLVDISVGLKGRIRFVSQLLCRCCCDSFPLFSDGLR